MKHAHTWTLLALGILMLCTACNPSQKTTTLVTPTTQQVTSLKWDETIAATTTARVNNASLISMR